MQTKIFVPIYEINASDLGSKKYIATKEIYI